MIQPTDIIDWDDLVGKTIKAVEAPLVSEVPSVILVFEDGTRAEIEAVAWWDAMNDKGGGYLVITAVQEES